jgi:hypothetical protein
MKFITAIFLIANIALFTACNNDTDKTTGMEANKTDTTSKQSTTPATLVFDKLVGLWQSENGKNFERWTKNDDGTFAAAAFSVKGKDTSWNEQARIYKEGDNWVFENTVKGQNDGRAVKFTSSSISDNSVQFSNPAHDFPTDINYTVPDGNTVNAFIIGPNQKGGKDTIPFNYKRAQ